MRRVRRGLAPASADAGHAADGPELALASPCRIWSGRHDRRTRLAHVFGRNGVGEPTASTSKVASNAWTRDGRRRGQLRKGARIFFFLRLSRAACPRGTVGTGCWAAHDHDRIQELRLALCAATGAAAATTHSQQRMACSVYCEGQPSRAMSKVGCLPPSSSYPSPSSPLQDTRKARLNARDARGWTTPKKPHITEGACADSVVWSARRRVAPRPARAAAGGRGAGSRQTPQSGNVIGAASGAIGRLMRTCGGPAVALRADRRSGGHRGGSRRRGRSNVSRSR